MLAKLVATTCVNLVRLNVNHASLNVSHASLGARLVSLVSLASNCIHDFNT